MQQPELKAIEPIISKLPPVFYLDNGVEVNTIPMDNCDLVAVTLMFLGGEWVQDKKLQSDFAFRQIRTGTEFTANDVITEKLDFYGATLTAGATASYGFVQIIALKRTLPELLPLLCEIVTVPSFEQQKLDYALEEGVFACNVSLQNVTEVCKRLFYKKLLGETHPISQFADEADYKKLTRDDLLRYHKKCINMDNAVVYLTGKVDDDMIALVNKHIGSIKTSGRGKVVLQKADTAPLTEFYFEKEIPVPSPQSALRLGKVMPDLTHPDYAAMLFVGSVLGGYFGSRLMRNIREKLGLTYGIGTTFYNLPHATVFITATETTKKHVSRCVKEVKKDIVDLQQNLITEEEMELAKNYVLGQFCRMTETSYSLSTVMMSKRSYGQTLNDWLVEQKKIQALSAEELREIARKYFSVDDMLVAVASGK